MVNLLRICSVLLIAAPASLLIAAPAFAQIPGTPQNLTSTVNGSTVTLAWSAPPSGGPPTGYVVEAALTPGGGLVATLQVAGTSLVVPGVPNGVYYVRVRARNNLGASAPSNEVTVVVSGGCPAPPLPPELIVRSVALQGSATWGPSGGCAPTTYTLLVGSGPGLSDIVIVNAGSQLGLSTLAPPGVYYVRVIGTNTFGTAVSEERIVRVAPNAQTDTAPVNGAVAIDVVMTGTGTYRGTLVWDDPAIDLDFYFTTAGCPYPPTTCLIAISDTTGTTTEAVSASVTAGQAYRLWVDNFSTRATSFTIFNAIGASVTESATPDGERPRITKVK
jgi:hypothetical protein